MVARKNDHEIEDDWEAEFLRTHPNVVFVGPEEGMRILTARTQEYLGITGEEFLKRLKTRDFPEDVDPEVIARLAMLSHFTE
jgi:hypothetical protein